MKQIRIIITILLIFALTFPLSACAKDAEGELCGSWAYIHDKEKAAMKIKADTLTLDGDSYGYTLEGDFIMLTRKGETTALRYLVNEDGSEMYIYKHSLYTLEGEKGEGLVGKWVGENGKWSFTFKDNGEFNEDGYFPGHYSVDSENATFKLMYEDRFEDTVCYYSLEGDTLTVEYPWLMVKMG